MCRERKTLQNDGGFICIFFFFLTWLLRRVSQNLVCIWQISVPTRGPVLNVPETGPGAAMMSWPCVSWSSVRWIRAFPSRAVCVEQHVYKWSLLDSNCLRLITWTFMLGKESWSDTLFMTNLFSSVGERKRAQTFILVQNTPIPSADDKSLDHSRTSPSELYFPVLVHQSMHHDHLKIALLPKRVSSRSWIQACLKLSTGFRVLGSTWDVPLPCPSLPRFPLLRRNLASLHHLESFLSLGVSTLFMWRVAAEQGSVPRARKMRRILLLSFKTLLLADSRGVEGECTQAGMCRAVTEACDLKICAPREMQRVNLSLDGFFTCFPQMSLVVWHVWCLVWI